MEKRAQPSDHAPQPFRVPPAAHAVTARVPLPIDPATLARVQAMPQAPGAVKPAIALASTRQPLPPVAPLTTPTHAMAPMAFAVGSPGPFKVGGPLRPLTTAGATTTAPPPPAPLDPTLLPVDDAYHQPPAPPDPALLPVDGAYHEATHPSTGSGGDGASAAIDGGPAVGLLREARAPGARRGPRRHRVTPEGGAGAASALFGALVGRRFTEPPRVEVSDQERIVTQAKAQGTLRALSSLPDERLTALIGSLVVVGADACSAAHIACHVTAFRGDTREPREVAETGFRARHPERLPDGPAHIYDNAWTSTTAKNVVSTTVAHRETLAVARAALGAPGAGYIYLVDGPGASVAPFQKLRRDQLGEGQQYAAEWEKFYETTKPRVLEPMSADDWQKLGSDILPSSVGPLRVANLYQEWRTLPTEQTIRKCLPTSWDPTAFETLSNLYAATAASRPSTAASAVSAIASSAASVTSSVREARAYVLEDVDGFVAFLNWLVEAACPRATHYSDRPDYHQAEVQMTEIPPGAILGYLHVDATGRIQAAEPLPGAAKLPTELEARLRAAIGEVEAATEPANADKP